LQAYASYSLKKIYNVNTLDLAKVGKAFGFAVPPRVSINMGEGTSRTASGKKRRRGGNDEDESEDFARIDQDVDVRGHQRRENKNRRLEAFGKKRVKKEMYRRKTDHTQSNAQWTR
jgi:ATP-dependent RNA helicase DDX18/HAS1